MWGLSSGAGEGAATFVASDGNIENDVIDARRALRDAVGRKLRELLADPASLTPEALELANAEMERRDPEHVAVEAPPPPPAAALDTWLGAFQASLSDLDANRAGTLSPLQVQRVRDATRTDAVFMSGFALVASAVMLFVLWLVWSSGKPVPWALYALILALPVSASLWAARTIYIHRRYGDVTRVRVLEGITTRHVLSYKGTSIYSLTVDGHKLDITEAIYAHIVDGAAHRIYYVPGSRIVVMIEPYKLSVKPSR
jgi:hypothetical protein